MGLVDVADGFVSISDRLEAKQYLDSLRNLIIIDSLDFEAAAKEYSEDKLTSGSGGFLQAEDGSTKVATTSYVDTAVSPIVGIV